MTIKDKVLEVVKAHNGVTVAQIRCELPEVKGNVANTMISRMLFDGSIKVNDTTKHLGKGREYVVVADRFERMRLNIERIESGTRFHKRKFSMYISESYQPTRTVSLMSPEGRQPFSENEEDYGTMPTNDRLTLFRIIHGRSSSLYPVRFEDGACVGDCS